ncbi:MAG: hydroxyacylglutathione hydrolase [Burkholderiales bacterium]
MKLTSLPALKDNYIWMLHDEQHALVVDPGDAAPVLLALKALKLELVGILVTHHHHDHVGGLPLLRSVLQGEVVGPSRESITGPLKGVSEGDIVQLGPWAFRVMDIPGHTLGHVAYVGLEGSEAPVLFCGDTLFSGGCGRLFEGTAAQMLRSLHKLSALPPQTRVCCAHEYTVANLTFAQAVEPGNAQITDHLAWAKRQRHSGKPTLPSSIELESRINPFLRCKVPEVLTSAQTHSGMMLINDFDFIGELAVFTILRQWKNEFQI